MSGVTPMMSCFGAIQFAARNLHHLFVETLRPHKIYVINLYGVVPGMEDGYGFAR